MFVEGKRKGVGLVEGEIDLQFSLSGSLIDPIRILKGPSVKFQVAQERGMYTLLDH